MGMRRKYESRDSVHFGSEERKKRNVDVEKTLDGTVPWTDDTSSVLVCHGGVGE
jgi:hypothetical protein